MLSFEEKKEIVKKFGKTENDTGSTEVQVALLTKRIDSLAPHFAKNKLDFHSNRGLMKMIGRRKALLRYLQTHDENRYYDLIKELGLRK